MAQTSPQRRERAMAGLYDGIEEVGFKAVNGGYVFQTANPWLLGPRRRYFVTEAQKAEIAGRIRETMRRIKPFVFAAAVIIPCILIGAIFWFVSRGATLTVTEVDAAGHTTVHSQPIGAGGVAGTLVSEGGSLVTYKVSGAPGGAATITVTPISSTGQVGKPCTISFDVRGNTITLTGDHDRILRRATLVGRVGPSRGATLLFSILFTAAVFAAYFVAIHTYSMARLRPLLTGLPRSSERIGLMEGLNPFAARISNKLLVVIGIGAIVPLMANGIDLISAIHASRQIDALVLVGPAGSVLATAFFVYLVAARIALKRRAAPAN
jgi:hypothetical protein